MIQHLQMHPQTTRGESRDTGAAKVVPHKEKLTLGKQEKILSGIRIYVSYAEREIRQF